MRCSRTLKSTILFVGGSTARRTYATFYAILNATDEPDDITIQSLSAMKVIDVNKRNITEECHKEGYLLCRTTPRAFDYMIASCLVELMNMTENHNSQFWRDLANYSLVVVIIGPWEMVARCQLYAPVEGWEMRFRRFLEPLYNDNGKAATANTTIIWRTWGSMGRVNDSTALGSWEKALQYNEYFKEEIDARNQASRSSAVSYIDWAHAMKPGLFPYSKRIKGDIAEHNGLEARLTFIQMLTNHFVERDRQEGFAQ